MAKSFPNTGATVIDSSADLPAASAALEGVMMFQKDTNQLLICDGSTWVGVTDTDNKPMDAWTSYTPTLTQSGNVPKNVTAARYLQVGKTVTVMFELIISGAGGTGGNRIEMGLPIAARNGSLNVFTGVGSATVYRAANVTVYPAVVLIMGTSTVAFASTRSNVANGTQYLGITDMTVALANGDYIGGSFTYEAA
jgi:hypothetical protein